MRFRVVIWLCLVVAACSKDSSVTPNRTGGNNEPPTDTTIMTAMVENDSFLGLVFCEDHIGPPKAARTFWAENDANGVRFEADLTEFDFRVGVTQPLGWDTGIDTPGGRYVLRDRGFGTITLSRFNDAEVAGELEAKLIHQRNLADTASFDGLFTADPYTRTVSLSGTFNGQPFQSNTGRESFPRVRARTCIYDAGFANGLGGSITLTALNISGNLLGSHPVFKDEGFASIIWKEGAVVYIAFEGMLHVQAVDSIAVPDSTGTLAYRRFITRAAFDFTATDLIVFGDESVDTISVTNGQLIYTDLPDNL